MSLNARQEVKGVKMRLAEVRSCAKINAYLPNNLSMLFTCAKFGEYVLGEGGSSQWHPRQGDPLAGVLDCGVHDVLHAGHLGREGHVVRLLGLPLCVEVLPHRMLR